MKSKNLCNKPSLALRAAALQQHMTAKLFQPVDPIVRPIRSPMKNINLKKNCNCHHFNPIPTSTIFESNSVDDKRRYYESKLTLAEKMGFVEKPPAPLSNEQFETVKIEAQKRGFYNESCPICLEKFGPDNMVLLSCSHLLHATCLMNFRRFVRSGHYLCPVCRQPYEFVQVKAESAYHHRMAMNIQRVFRGFLIRNKLDELAPQGSELHRKWVITKAHLASDKLVSAVDKQSDAIDAVLGSIDNDLEWARGIMKAIEQRERAIDWYEVKKKKLQEGLGECPVCIRQMNSHNASVTSCGHCFHTRCLSSWLRFCNDSSQAPTCPVCRSGFQCEKIEDDGVECIEEEDEEDKTKKKRLFKKGLMQKKICKRPRFR